MRKNLGLKGFLTLWISARTELRTLVCEHLIDVLCFCFNFFVSCRPHVTVSPLLSVILHLCVCSNDFSRMVAEEYLSFFNFTGLGIDQALRWEHNVHYWALWELLFSVFFFSVVKTRQWNILASLFIMWSNTKYLLCSCIFIKRMNVDIAGTRLWSKCVFSAHHMFL